MIVPVWVAAEQAPSSEILTYALLDTQSDSSFILDEVAQALNAKQQPIRLKLSTMTSSSNIDCSVTSSILVRGMMSPSQLKIGKCYTRDFIPTDREHIPSRSTAEKWTHLQDVAREMPALQRCEIGLLIGYNCPRALTPRQVVTGSDVEPFAIRTDLGWSIVGFAEEENAMDFSSQCGRVSTREIPFPKPKEIIGLLETDFAEDKSPDKACSQNDLQFLNDPSADAPLTPNHLLTLKRTVPLPPPGQFVKEDVYTRKAWRRVQFLLEQFWSRWRKEYLLGLQRRQKWTMPRRNLQVGDIVLLTDDEAPRMKWPIAMVAEATPDEDGLVRRVQVRVGTKDLDNKGRPNKKLAEYWRPVQKLVLLLETVPP
eukprot:XP_011666214.1 PREDICTED: uncharacterized protein LOC105439199 [Strongylocentrotus purpuratus]